MLYIFDLDSTLVVRFKTEPLPYVIERTAALKTEGHEIAVATNQAGLAWRLHTQSAKYPDPDRLAKRFEIVARRIPTLIAVPWFMAIYDSRVEVCAENYSKLADELSRKAIHLNLQISAQPDWRKPGPGMLQAAMAWYGCDADQTFFVGDMDTDAEAALAAGVHFVYADAFFENTPLN